MLTIFAPTDRWHDLQQTIRQEDRLHELIDLADSQQPDLSITSPSLIVEGDHIRMPLDWGQRLPPLLLPERWAYTPEVLLGLIFHQLGNDQKVWQYLHAHPDFGDLEYQAALKYQLPIDDSYPQGMTYRALHNQAVVMHYGVWDETPPPGEVLARYRQALDLAPHVAYRAFTARELASLWLDGQELDQASRLLDEVIELPLPQEAVMSLKMLRNKVWMQQLVVPYAPGQLKRLKAQLWELLTYYEAQGDPLQTGFLLLDATHVASLSSSHTEALGYVKQAIDLFDDAEVPELLAQAQIQKGTLLATWAQLDQPQFYKPAVESYQQALKVFTKEAAPNIFADIHHQLGVLYAEMPAENKRRAIWAGVASSSFQEALAFYTKEQYPYEYASICTHFANAYTKFPPALHSDNHVKALGYYEEALAIRTAQYPYERAITLLNYLEANWNVGNDESSFNQARFDDMIAKAEEVLQLVADPDMQATAQAHIDHLQKLKVAVQKEKSDA